MPVGSRGSSASKSIERGTFWRDSDWLQNAISSSASAWSGAMPGITPCAELADELIAFCSQSLSRQKVPRSIDFEEQLPRLPTGKLYKRLLRDRYWGNKTSRIV